jgi:hypothetical protein
VASFHSYNWTTCNTASCWNADVAPLSAFVPVVTGEIGEADCSSAYMSKFTAWADQHAISYLAWSWEPPPAWDTTCTVSPSGSSPGDNLQLLSSWTTEAPSTAAPEGAFIKQLLLLEHAGSL